MILNIVDFTVSDTVATLTRFNETATAVRSRTGCLQYEIFTDPSAPARLLIVQKWADMAAFDAYRAGSEMAAQMAGMGPLMTGAPLSVTLSVTPMG